MSFNGINLNGIDYLPASVSRLEKAVEGLAPFLKKPKWEVNDPKQARKIHREALEAINMMKGNQALQHLKGDLNILGTVLKQICVPKNEEQSTTNEVCLNLLRARIHTMVTKEINKQRKEKNNENGELINTYFPNYGTFSTQTFKNDVYK